MKPDELKYFYSLSYQIDHEIIWFVMKVPLKHVASNLIPLGV